jgi:hypothetical protein
MVRVAFLHGQKNGSAAEAPAAALGSPPKAGQADIITGRAFERVCSWKRYPESLRLE